MPTGICNGIVNLLGSGQRRKPGQIKEVALLPGSPAWARPHQGTDITIKLFDDQVRQDIMFGPRGVNKGLHSALKKNHLECTNVHSAASLPELADSGTTAMLTCRGAPSTAAIPRRLHHSKSQLFPLKPRYQYFMRNGVPDVPRRALVIVTLN